MSTSLDVWQSFTGQRRESFAGSAIASGGSRPCDLSDPANPIGHSVRLEGDCATARFTISNDFRPR